MGASTVEEGDGIVRVTVSDEVPDTETEQSDTSTVAGSDTEQPTPSSEAAPASEDSGGSDAGASDEKQDLAIQKQEEAAKTALESAGLSLTDFTDEYAKNGSLSEESMGALVNKAGIPREIVEGYISGQEALAAQNVTSITAKAFELAGSQEEYKGLTEWAAANLSDEQQEAYNESVNSMNPSRTEQAIRGLIQQRQASDGFEGSTVEGGTIAGSRVDVYADKSGMLSDLADVRYQKSAAFRSKVDAKVARSMQAHGGSLPS